MVQTTATARECWADERHEPCGTVGTGTPTRGAGQAQKQQVEHQAVVLGDEGGELQAADDAVRVGVRHVLVADHHVVLGCKGQAREKFTDVSGMKLACPCTVGAQGNNDSS